MDRPLRGSRLRHGRRDSSRGHSGIDRGANERPSLGRPPPGLRGKEIGLWHARRGKLRKEHATRLMVTLDKRSVENIERVLNTHGGDKTATSSNTHSHQSNKGAELGPHGERPYDQKSYDSRSLSSVSPNQRLYDARAHQHRSHDSKPYQNWSHDSRPHDSKSHEQKPRDPWSHDPRSHDSRSHDARSHDARSHDARSHDARSHDARSHDPKPHDPRPHASRSNEQRLYDPMSCGSWSGNQRPLEQCSYYQKSGDQRSLDQAQPITKYEPTDEPSIKREPVDDVDFMTEETTAEFMIEYTENLLQNDQSNKQNIELVCESELRADPVRDEMLREELAECNRRGNSMLVFRKKLPSFQKQYEVLKVIARNQVVVISGETGCGKTTQVPQFILDNQIESGKGSTCRIICTQPRRISAISVAERVAEERCEAVGKSVGYSIRLSHVLPRDYASITYCTTGILLKILTSNRHLADYSHVIVDEVHERDIQTDFLLILLRDLLQSRPSLKVILMSATLNAEHFSEYFYNAAMFNIPGFTFTVTEYYLEDIVDIVRYDASEGPMVGNTFNHRGRQNTEKREKEQAQLAALREWINSSNLCLSYAGVDTILKMDHTKVHPKLISDLVKHICTNKPEGAILVFLPGWSDISEVNKLLKESLQYISTNIIPLHSLMPTTEQRDVFRRSPPGVRKIVLATNIAETSITIDDVVYVVNAGKIKLTDYLSDKNMNSLQSHWVSKANSRQRRGRAGRVQPGICYHLYTTHHESLLEEYLKPEMVRSRLENICLDVKLLNQGYVKPFLLKAMDPPSLEAIDSSLDLLKTLNALDKEERLTSLGYHLARIPLDPHTGKMILMGAMFSCLDPVLCIAACLNFKDPFQVPLDKVQEVDATRRRLSRNTQSDLLMYYYAIKGWEEARNRSAYCWDNFISPSTVSMVHKLKGQFARLLHDLKFISTSNSCNREANRNSENMALVRAVLCAGLYPNVAKAHCISKRGIIKLSTKSEKGICIHPKSVNAVGNLTKKGQWIMYYELLKLNSTIFVMDSTLMPAFPIMFFGGELKQEVKGDGELIPMYQAVVVDDWISFQCDWKNVQLINKLRAQLNEVLQQKISSPKPTNWDPHVKEGATLQAIVDLLSTEVSKPKTW